MKAQFDTPESPLTVAPITVQGDVAIAGWSQNGMGGRAFLRKDAEGWFVEVCAGQGLLMPEMLTGLGLAEADATTREAGGGGTVALRELPGGCWPFAISSFMA